ncbi:hypothetical protein, partial [Proteus mirabilis]|uniref:hypothetical protein n=1 Tax=Proteus mirabilis TaxID=584 RepID=UPI0023F66BE1
MGSCAAPSAKGDDKFITTDYLQQCPTFYQRIFNAKEYHHTPTDMTGRYLFAKYTNEVWTHNLLALV